MNQLGQSATPSSKRYVVEQFTGVDPKAQKDTWRDVAVVEAPDAGAALRRVVIANPNHRIAATTYRVCEEALFVDVSINLGTRDAR